MANGLPKDKSTKIPPFRYQSTLSPQSYQQCILSDFKFFLILMEMIFLFNLYFPRKLSILQLVDHLNFFMKKFSTHTLSPFYFSFSVYRCLLFWILILILLQDAAVFLLFTLSLQSQTVLLLKRGSQTTSSIIFWKFVGAANLRPHFKLTEL